MWRTSRETAAEVRALLKENIPTPREIRERHEFVRKILQLRSREAKSSGQFPSMEEMIREDRER
jgi:hypothetical protein